MVFTNKITQVKKFIKWNRRENPAKIVFAGFFSMTPNLK
jgi:hypothetical protein